MFDLQADDGSVSRKPYNSPVPNGATPKPLTPAQLDSAKMVRMHGMLIDYYTRELEKQGPNRLEMAQEEDFYDNIQWSEEDAQALRDRGQIPLVYNVISASIDWVIGTEKRTRTDFKVLPRRKEASKPAERKTQLMKYLADVNRSPFSDSRAFADGAKVGLGWLEDAIDTDSDREPLTHRYESWRHILHDSLGGEMDVEDGRFVFRSKWVDVDVACAIFPRRKRLIEMSADEGDDYMGLDSFGDEAMDQKEIELEGNTSGRATDAIVGYRRRRVRMIEGWVKIPTKMKRLKGGAFDREMFDPYSPGHVESLESGEAEIVERTAMKVYVAILTPKGMLYFGPSPYRHNRYPFTPVWGKRRGRDGLPYGMIRSLKDIQVDVNKRASKALYILSTSKIIMDEGAVDDVEELRQEAARPDAIIEKKKGYELDINADRELSQFHIELMGRSIQLIQSASGVTDENLGRRTNAVSGVAIGKRQEQGSLATAGYFDNYRFAKQVSGEKQLSLIEQFMDERKQFRITNMRGTAEYIEVNDGLPENDIIRSKADFIIDEEDWRASLRQAAVDQLLETLSRFPPEISMQLLDLVVEDMDIRHREELVKRIRSITGQRDPDAEEMTPEEQAKAEAAAKASQLNEATAMATLRKLIAEAVKIENEAQRIEAQTVGQRVSTQSSALGAAQEALMLPAGAHVADHILAESGFVSASDRAAAAPGIMPAGAAAPQSPEVTGLTPPPTPPAPMPAAA